MLVCVFQFTHPLGVKVLLDCEAVDDAGGRQTALYTGQQDQQQGQLRGSHSIMKKQAVGLFLLCHYLIKLYNNIWCFIY